MSNPAVVALDPRPAREPDHIHVFLRDCRVELNVGAYAHETLRRQPVIVDLEVEAALPHHYQDLRENNLDRVINYEHFYDFIRNELAEMGHIPLLETVAEQIIAFCFRDSRIQKVRVRLEKPKVYAGEARAGIEMCRTRHD